MVKRERAFRWGVKAWVGYLVWRWGAAGPGGGEGWYRLLQAPFGKSMCIYQCSVEWGFLVGGI